MLTEYIQSQIKVLEETKNKELTSKYKLQATTYMSFADSFVNPIANACSFPSAIIACNHKSFIKQPP